MKNIAKPFFLILAILGGEAGAAVCTSLASGNWNSAAIWSCGVVPGSGDSVTIASPHTVSLGTTNRSAASLTIDVGATLDDNGRDIAVSGSVLINGTYDGTGNNGNLTLTGNGQTLSGTGTIIDIGRVEIDGNITIPAGSNLNLTQNSEIRVGNNNPATLTIDGTITGTALSNGNRIIRLDNDNTSNVIVNGTIDAPNSFLEIQAGGTLTNNGAVTLLYLDGNDDSTATWTQGANSSLTLSQPAQSWSGTLNASAAGNTVTYNAPATPIAPSGNTYYNLAGTGVTCPVSFVILGSSPCTAPSGTISVTASPSACINVADIGTRSWSTLTGPFASDDAYATASVGDNQTTNYLQCTGYGFTIPPNATIVGVTVSMERRASDTLVRDAAMRLVKAGTIQATDRSTATNYTTADVVEAHGGTTDLWGDTWTPANINDPDFGAAFASRKAGTSGGTRTVRVDHMQITVTYTFVPVAEYRMDESGWNGTTDEVADNSGNALHGTAQLNATTATAKVCNGANLSANYVEAADNALLDIANTLTVTAWLKPARWGGGAGKDALMSFLSKDTNYEAHIDSAGRVFWWWGTGSMTSTGTAPIGSWTHVALVYTNGSQTIYINGVASGTAAFTGALPTNANPLQIGDDQLFGGGTRRFDGMIDEVKIFNVALTGTQISNIYTNENAGKNWDGTARTCQAYGPHHIEIQHDGNGLTCSAETVTIRACADAAVPCNTLYTAGNLSVTLSPGGQAFTIDATGVNSAASVQQLTAGTATLSAISVPAATSATTCWNTATSTASCDMTFSNAGFFVTVPDHVSCNNASVTIEAVQTAPGSGRCVPAYRNTTRAVSLYTTYTNPSSGTMTATASADGGANWFTLSTAAPGAAQNLSFNASGTATILLNYQDAGQLTLNATGTAPTGASLVGSSTFVSAPASFVFGGIPAAPLTAGQPFNAAVTAKNACATPTTTPNFTGQTVTITSSNPQPALGNATAINASLTAANGTGSVDLIWNEVGTIDLNASLPNYLGSVLSINGSQTGVGRFKPAYFDTAVIATATTPMPCPVGSTCPVLYNGFVYSGQPFSAQVTARSATGNATANYRGAFANAVTLEAWDALGSTTTQNPGGGALTNAAVAAADFVSGVATLATLTYTFAAVPTAPTDIFLRATESSGTDDVTSLRATPGASVEGGVKIANGRVRVSNAHGSELLPLPLTATVQYYNGTFWVTSTTDDVTSLTLAATYDVLDKQGTIMGTTTPTPTGAAMVTDGILAVKLSKPTGGAGRATISLVAPAWLPLTDGLATFGVYKGNNEFIYMRENY